MGFNFERTSDGDCGQQNTAPDRPVIGAIGWVRPTDDNFCGFSFDFTLFFLAADGSIDAERFQSDSVSLLC